MSMNKTATVELHADQEHTGIRVAVVLVLVAAFALTFILASSALNALPEGGVGGFALPISCVIGLLVALGIAAVAEHLLKQRWHSGRGLVMDEHGIEAQLADDSSISLGWDKRMAATKWYFSLKGYPRGGRERRVPASWLCLGCQLQQDEHRLVVFGFLPRTKAESLLEDGDFHEIRPAELYDLGPFRRRLASTDRPKLPASLLTGKGGPYWLAEKRRWASGLELTAEDLAIFIEIVDSHVKE